MADIVERLKVISEADVHETWRYGTLDKHDLLKWEALMLEAAAEIELARAALTAMVGFTKTKVAEGMVDHAPELEAVRTYLRRA
jgi:uncharacterized protein (UPF0548 family)